MTMAPTTTTSELDALLARDFTASCAPQLEAYVQAAAAGTAPYHAAAVRRLIKVYQFVPQQIKPEILATACWLTLLQYPNPTDYLAIQHMIPITTMQNDDTTALIAKAFDHLQACEFTQFWTVYNDLKQCDALKAYLTKDDNNDNDVTVKTLQGKILQVLALTYKEAPASVVLPALHATTTTTTTTAAAACQGHDDVVDRVVVTADTVVFHATKDNTKRQRVYQESLDFQSISALMSKIAQ